MENVRNRIKTEILKKGVFEKILTQLSKQAFNRIHRSCTIHDIYTFKHKEVLLEKPICLEFAVLKLSKIFMYKAHYDKLQTYFGEKNMKLHYMDADSFLLSINSSQNFKDLQNFGESIDISNLNKDNGRFSEKKQGRY